MSGQNSKKRWYPQSGHMLINPYATEVTFLWLFAFLWSKKRFETISRRVLARGVQFRCLNYHRINISEVIVENLLFWSLLGVCRVPKWPNMRGSFCSNGSSSVKFGFTLSQKEGGNDMLWAIYIWFFCFKDWKCTSIGVKNFLPNRYLHNFHYGCKNT